MLFSQDAPTLILLAESASVSGVVESICLRNEIQLHASLFKCLILAVEILQTVAQALFVGQQVAVWNVIHHLFACQKISKCDKLFFMLTRRENQYERLKVEKCITFLEAVVVDLTF